MIMMMMVMMMISIKMNPFSISPRAHRSIHSRTPFSPFKSVLFFSSNVHRASPHLSFLIIEPICSRPQMPRPSSSPLTYVPRTDSSNPYSPSFCRLYPPSDSNTTTRLAHHNTPPLPPQPHTHTHYILHLANQPHPLQDKCFVDICKIYCLLVEAYPWIIITQSHPKSLGFCPNRVDPPLSPEVGTPK